MPKPFMQTLASLFVFLLTSISAVKKSVRTRLTCSLVELVTRLSEAKERVVCSLFGVDYRINNEVIYQLSRYGIYVPDDFVLFHWQQKMM